MACRIQSIVPDCGYRVAGIDSIQLLDFDDFGGCKFEGDELYSNCFVTAILRSGEFVGLDATEGAAYTSSFQNGLYTHTLETFIGDLSANLGSMLHLATKRRYLVIFRAKNGGYFAFGYDAGAKVTYANQTSDSPGSLVTITATSIYPLFQVDAGAFIKAPEIVVFTTSQEWTVPGGVSLIEVFAVGGGGAGKEGYTQTPGRNGGSGGQIILQTLSVTPGATYPVTIGPGGLAFNGGYYAYSANPGGNTTFGDILTALGGLGGYCPAQNNLGSWPQPVVEGSATGGSVVSPSTLKKNGEDGQLCPFDLSAFPDLDGERFAPGGGAGSGGVGGETGGGKGGSYSSSIVPGAPGTFYGAGGGGGMYRASVAYDGYQGILIIRY
jgi:hypothetical protein